MRSSSVNGRQRCLGLGVFSRVLGSPRVHRPVNEVASWSFFGAGLGAILASAFWRITGKRKDSPSLANGRRR